MNFTAIKKHKISKLSKALLLVAVIFYFSYHIVSGDKGIMAMIQLQQRVNSAHSELVITEVEKIKLKHRVGMMYSSAIDQDLLDEQARRLLGFANGKELVMMDY